MAAQAEIARFEKNKNRTPCIQKEEAIRHTQIMSIFGVGDCRSDFFSESLPALTVWQSEHGCAPSNVSVIA